MSLCFSTGKGSCQWWHVSIHSPMNSLHSRMDMGFSMGFGAGLENRLDDLDMSVLVTMLRTVFFREGVLLGSSKDTFRVPASLCATDLPLDPSPRSDIASSLRCVNDCESDFCEPSRANRETASRLASSFSTSSSANDASLVEEEECDIFADVTTVPPFEEDDDDNNNFPLGDSGGGCVLPLRLFIELLLIAFELRRDACNAIASRFASILSSRSLTKLTLVSRRYSAGISVMPNLSNIFSKRPPLMGFVPTGGLVIEM